MSTEPGLGATPEADDEGTPEAANLTAGPAEASAAPDTDATGTNSRDDDSRTAGTKADETEPTRPGRTDSADVGDGAESGGAAAAGPDGVGGGAAAAGPEGVDNRAESGGAAAAGPEGVGGGAESDGAAAAGADGVGDGGESGGAAAVGADGVGGGVSSGSGPGGGSGSGGDAAEAAQRSEAEAELAAQRVERERIERRKAERKPVESGGKLSGTAADLLAAIRAVEGGEKPAATVFGDPEPAPRRAAPAPEPVRRPQPAAPAATGPAAETVTAVRGVLADGGAPESLAPQVAAALGEGADVLLREDPWQLLRVHGVRPDQADGFARALLGAECGPDDERRGRALTGWLLEQAALAGHTALEMPTLATALAQRAVPDPDAAVQSALAEGEALVFQDALDPGAPEPADDEEERPVRVLVGLERYALAEESLADGLARLVNSLAKDAPGPWDAVAAAASGGAAELARAVAGHGLVLHTGGEAARAEPAALLAAARAAGLRAFAAAHTHDGLRQLTAPQEEGGAAAVGTVAGLLAGAEGPGRDAEGALDLDLLIVLDAPQLDVESAAMVVEALPDGARLVLSGDPAVLWSAGPGRVFADLLAARVCPQLASRTPDPGPLGELVSGIGVGELLQVDAPGKEVVIVPVRDAGEAVHRTVQLVADSVPRAIGVPAEQTVVITPGHGGAAGTRALNTALKERLNPGPGRFGGFDPGDRIAFSPAPGRTVPGRVVKADGDGLHLACAGGPVVVPKEQVEQSLRHGWAVTAHQAAGGRWPAVVVVLPGDAAQSLSRPWVYTAFSRAERHLSVVHGVEQALPRAVAEALPKPRTTRLPLLLRTLVPTAG
ncbi:ATP-binding domain-containing protein [Streptomyces arenae]|uniref:ATP-binding domain-containing protein n=1 Tax=Streptomyces arenae TaxID=29301 RepID=UPI00265A9E23|nr:ATP-binding domain-containing protein [Streptomyces arenae]MCG7207716.1 ATP-binding domain-containing protein [Streptomyces arenae]